jgi:hypothetical protein
MMNWCEWCMATKDGQGKLVHKPTCCLHPLAVPEFSQIPEDRYCSKCRSNYTGNPSDHFNKTCVYELGCPHCGHKWISKDHIEPCEKRQKWLRTETPDEANKGPLELLSYRKPAIASSVEAPGLDARRVTDAMNDTRWSSRHFDCEWIMVDLEQMCRIDKVILSWEAAHARQYVLEFSMDAVTWYQVFDQKNGRGGVEVIPLLSVDTFDKRHARFVRVNCSKRATQWGYSLWAFEILGERVDKTYIAKHRAPKPDMSNKTPEEQVLASDWWGKDTPINSIRVIDERNKEDVHSELLP